MVERHLGDNFAAGKAEAVAPGPATLVGILPEPTATRIKSVAEAYFASLRELGGLVKSAHMVPDEEDGSVRIVNVLTERVRFRGVPDPRFARLSRATASFQLGLYPDVVTRVASLHSSREQDFLRSFADRGVGVVSVDVMGSAQVSSPV